MTDSIIKQVPDILENPIVIMKSKSNNSRITLFGEVYSNNKPILAVVELYPKSRQGLTLDELKIASAYGKDNAQKFIDSSDVLFMDSNKKRVSKWEKRTGLYLPVGSSISNSNNIISQTTEKSNTQFQARDTYVDYTNTDLSTLDDKELKVYNKRGWANALFTEEDRRLLSEKYNELNTRTKQRTDNVLGDGSRVVEVNNKLVLIGGTFEEPVIHNVLAINAENETDAEFYKEWICNDFETYKQSKEYYIDNSEVYESIFGKAFARNFRSTDYGYYKGRQDSGERAVLPDSFQSYGYTKQFQDGRGNSSETQQGISDEVEYQPRGLAMSDSELLANAEDTANAKPTFDLSGEFARYFFLKQFLE